jgi:FAD/FMN-containing dehydrogenase
MVDTRNTSTKLPDDRVQELRGSFRGTIFREGDSGYDGARRVWNGRIDRRPAMIARCAGAADVIQTIQFARDHDLPVAIRGGAHHVAGLATRDGGVVIDLSRMKGIRIDPERRTALALPGLTWGEYQNEAQAFGLATPAGVISTTGIAGLTMGGGIGFLARKYGLTIDNLLSVDIVTADAKLRRASADQNADLFWAVRGGDGNFGVVTAFEYRLQPVSAVQAGMLVYPLARAGEVLRAYREFTATCPEDLSTIPILGNTPDGTPALIVALCHVGSAEAAATDLRPLRNLGPVAEQVGAMPFITLQQMFDQQAPFGQQTVWRSGNLTALSDDFIDALVESNGSGLPSPLSSILIYHLGGAASRVAPDATAYPHRNAQFTLAIGALWSDPAEAERCLTWTERVWEATRPFADGVYVNFLDAEGDDRVRGAYGANLARLAKVKHAFDPTNFFRTNHNIAPAA